ncbi:MAG: winged helix-turn-helix domain-containing protein [Acidobacteriota bacterium]|nr:winged helix-turn-helix domain-containing protein [Acidobacteriota bacterium]
MTDGTQAVYEFGSFRLSRSSRLLHRDGEVVPLKPKVFDTLLVLVEAAGRLLTKEQLMQAVWPDTAVEENNLSQNISALRRAFGEQPDEHRYIVTVPGQGYRFVAPVAEVPSGLAEQKRYPWARIAVAVCGLIVLVAAGYWISRRFMPPSRSKPVMLAVLPLQNLSGNPDEEFFSDGLTEEMITQLGRLEPDGLGVIARTTTMQYKATTKHVDQIGRELGVDYILEGSIRRGNDQVRVSAQLIRVSDQTHLWADSYQRDARDILAVQSQVASDIAREISLKLTPRKRAMLARTRSVDPKAHELYLRARFLWNKRTEGSLQKSIAAFQQAIEADPSYAESYAGLADAYIASGNWGFVAPKDAYPLAKSAAAKALEIDADSAEARVALAYATYLYDWNAGQAETQFRRALRLNPSYASGHQWYAVFLASRGRFDEAIAQINLARQIDPLSLIINDVVGWIYALARRDDRAIEEFRKGLDLDPNFYPVRYDLGITYAEIGRHKEAVEQLAAARALSGDTERTLSGLAYAYARGGDRANAENLLARLQEMSKGRYVPSYDTAEVYAALGEKDVAFSLLEKSLQDRYPWLVMLRVTPIFDPLRSDPRYSELVRRIVPQ